MTIKEYYKNKTFNALEKELFALVVDMENEEDKKNLRNFATKLYAFYMQLIEIFLINSFAVIEDNL